jgi:hypothetical protein
MPSSKPGRPGPNAGRSPRSSPKSRPPSTRPPVAAGPSPCRCPAGSQLDRQPTGVARSPVCATSAPPRRQPVPRLRRPPPVEGDRQTLGLDHHPLGGQRPQPACALSDHGPPAFDPRLDADGAVPRRPLEPVEADEAGVAGAGRLRRLGPGGLAGRGQVIDQERHGAAGHHGPTPNRWASRSNTSAVPSSGRVPGRSTTGAKCRRNRSRPPSRRVLTGGQGP